MRLISLSLENFRQHKSLEIQFPAGLTGILGVNGSGKSTILEAIAWAIYGNQTGVVRGELESLIWRYAPGKSSAVAELQFELDRQVYTVKRSQSSKSNTAELRQDQRVLANSTKAVNEKIIQILGMSHQEFFNSYFTAQRDLNFLGSIKGALERERFIAKMLGYERITEAQGATGKKGTIRDDKNEADKLVNRLEGGLEDRAQILAELEQYQTQLKAAELNQANSDRQLNELNHQLQLLIPQAELASEKRDRYQQISQNNQISQAKLTQVQSQTSQLDRERSLLQQKVIILSQLELEVANYSQLQEQLVQLEIGKRQSELQQNQIAKLKEQQIEAEKIANQIQQLEHIPQAIAQSEIAIANYQTQIQQQQKENDSQTQLWQQSQASLKASIQTEKQNLKKLEQQKVAIADAGIEGHCPTCERPLQEEYDRVIDGFGQQIEQIEQNLIIWKQQLKLQDSPPANLIQVQAILKQLQQEKENEQRNQIQLSTQVARLELLVASATQLQLDICANSAKISEFDHQFDSQIYIQVQSQLEQLKPKYEDYLRSTDAPEQLNKIELRLSQLNQEIGSLLLEIEQQEQQLSALDFNQTDYQNLKVAIANLESQINQSKQSQSNANQQLALSKQALQTSQARADQLATKAAELKIAKHELLLLREIDNSFTELRQHLTEQIRPQLADNASIFLNQLTEGRYNAIEIDSKYNVIVLDQGDRKPVISGGEEDIVNLCLRLAISQMIAERSGQSFSLLILDEVFGSLDQTRQDNVIALLHNLESQFEQVLLITHIDSIKDSLNHTIRLEFDSQTGSSFVVPS
jgi:DNA repair protein SbcC/Rad50